MLKFGFKGTVKCFRLPRLSPSMSQADHLVFHCRQGDWVTDYSLLLTLNIISLQQDALTDEQSATPMHVEVMEEMQIARIFTHKQNNETLPIGMPLAILCEDSNDMELVSILILQVYRECTFFSVFVIFYRLKRTQEKVV